MESAAKAPTPPPFELLSRSWRPIALRLRQLEEAALGLLRLRRTGQERLRHLPQRDRELRARVAEHGRVAAVDGDRHGPVGGDLEGDLDVERALDLLLRHPDLRVRAVE